MIAQQVVKGLYSITHKNVNVFLLEVPQGLVLIDTGLPGTKEVILQALTELKRQPKDIRWILLTHAHPDHIGSAAALKRLTGAKVYIHPLDAQIARKGSGFRPMGITSGIFSWMMVKLFPVKTKEVEPVETDELLHDQQTLFGLGNLQVIHTPGHCLGQVALLWPEHGGVLFFADTCMNLGGIRLTLVYEDLPEGKKSLSHLSELQFQVACFGHGKPVLDNAGKKFKKWLHSI